VYVGSDELPRPLDGLGVAIVSTNKGVLSDSEARQAKIGGEVLCGSGSEGGLEVMSRIGVKAIPLPPGVAVQVKDGSVHAKGPKGELSVALGKGFTVAIDEAKKTVTVKRAGDERQDRARHGLYRALINNVLIGVSTGFQRNLEIEGVGYNAKAEPKKLTLNIGFANPVSFEIPAGLTVETPKPTIIHIKGSSKQMVGQFAANVRKVRPPEPYKGKGIRYEGEVIKRKAGKAVGGKA
jgi:large subunit ribosomal protein L6